MSYFKINIVVLCLLYSSTLFPNITTFVAIEWSGKSPKGTVKVANGNLISMKIDKGRGEVKKDYFNIYSETSRLFLEVQSKGLNYGPKSPVVSLQLETNSFSFFLRDVSKKNPIYVPNYNVIVLPSSDKRSFEEIENEILDKNYKTKIQEISSLPESSFSSVSSHTRDMTSPTWLGVSRDFRIFEIAESLPDAAIGEANIISPKRAASPITLDVVDGKIVNYMFSVGRGIGVYQNIKRNLENGSLPILNTLQADDDILYHSKAFVAFENSSFKSLKGTDYLLAAKYSGGPNKFTNEQEEYIEKIKPEYIQSVEETVLFYRVEAENTGTVPRYAWFHSPNPGNNWYDKYPFTYDAESGFSAFSSNKIFCISKLNGKALLNEEVSILLYPGEKAVFEFYLPHQPISKKRAYKLSSQSFENKLTETKSFWKSKLQKASKISVPEKRINQMIQAGLLHLDLITYGTEPNGVLAPNVGVYSPIGTESAPIIQYYTSMGLDSIAKRSLTYFFEKQHEDGLMQNFGGYMAETGAVLWTLGEYFRYTQDVDFILSLEEKILKSCKYLINWRSKNKKEDLKGRGYGMIDGQVADPEDHFHQFMLNGYGYLGMSRMAEVLERIKSKDFEMIKKEANGWRLDIKESVKNSLANSPLVPLGDGRWVPTLPPWTEADGPRSLYQKEERFWSHGTFTISDGMLGPMYLVFCEVLDPYDPVSKIILDYNSELFYQGNSAFSQPYYSRHNWLQARLGMIKPFLNTYYTTLSAHADRETYTFWEHMYKVSPHKTHEEAWFLMETRWMLYMEADDTLKLLNTIPRKWMGGGKSIELNGVRSYFGPINLKTVSKIDENGRGSILAEVNIDKAQAQKLESIVIRLPHPNNKKAIHVEGGQYNPETETVLINNFEDIINVKVEF